MTPNSLEAWQSEWDQLLAQQTEIEHKWRELGEHSGISEDLIMERLALVREQNGFRRNTFKTAWRLWIWAELLTWPRWWRPKKRRLYQQAQARLDNPLMQA